MIEGLVRTTVDGVTALHCPGRGGRVKAGLLFRVGRADESLAIAGITHLVEHLALHQQGLSDYHYNGATADLYTHFHVEGNAEHVVEYFNSVCASLRDLPLHRLETEKQILRTEQAGRSGGAAAQLPLMRYGAQGYGLAACEEMGLRAVTAQQVTDWAESNFTRDNAVFWLVGDGLPDALRLDLPRGNSNPHPEVTSVLPQTPAWFAAPGDVVCLHSLVARSTTAMIFARILSKALFTDLRQNGGYCYTAQADYQPLDHDLAAVVAVADSAVDQREAVVGAFVDVLARLRYATVSEAELASVKSSAMRDLEELDPAQRLPGYAIGELIGDRPQSLEELRAEVEAVTVAELRTIAEQVYSSALIQVPALGLDWAGVVRAPEWSENAVHGREYVPVGDNAGIVVVGREGVSVLVGQNAVTVLYRDCAAMQAYPDGGLRMVGRDGFSVTVEPTLNRLTPDVVGTILHAVPRSLLITMPPRTAAQIPQPHFTSPPARLGSVSGPGVGLRPTAGWSKVVRLTAFTIMGLIAGFFFLVAVSGTIVAANGDDPKMGPGGAIFLWVVFAIPAWITWKLRRPKRPRR